MKNTKQAVRLKKKDKVKAAPPRPPTVGDFYVVHATNSDYKEWFTSFKEAFAAFKIACRCEGSAAMWRGPQWSKLFVHGEYPDVPMVILNPVYESYVNPPSFSQLDDEESLGYFDRYIAGDR